LARQRRLYLVIHFRIIKVRIELPEIHCLFSHPTCRRKKAGAELIDSSREASLIPQPRPAPALGVREPLQGLPGRPGKTQGRPVCERGNGQSNFPRLRPAHGDICHARHSGRPWLRAAGPSGGAGAAGRFSPPLAFMPMKARAA
jgi:hypothetical protein